MKSVSSVLILVLVATATFGDQDVDFLRKGKCPNLFVMSTLWPCLCYPAFPSELDCSGMLVNDETLSMIERKVKTMLRFDEEGLKKALEQFTTLHLSHTLLTKIDNPILQLLPIKNVYLNSNRLMRRIQLNSFTHNTRFHNFVIENMKDVTITE